MSKFLPFTVQNSENSSSSKGPQLTDIKLLFWTWFLYDK